jgi:geranylgeranyl diphosphate synthase type II
MCNLALSKYNTSDIRVYHQTRKELIDRELKRLVGSLPRCMDPIAEAIQYSLLSDGKRLRPTVLMAAAESVGGKSGSALPYACMVEILHTGSLIHDDLPCIDDSPLRRGKPSSHVTFGEGIATLTGDAFLNWTYTCLLDTLLSRPQDRVMAWGMLKDVSECLNCLVGGQTREISLRGTKAGWDDMYWIIEHKTASLFQLAGKMGAQVGGGDEEVMRRLATYGRHFGIAFQLVDDIIDIVGNSSFEGKPTGMDEESLTPTLPRLFGVDSARDVVNREVTLGLRAVRGIHRSEILEGVLLYATLERLSVMDGMVTQ